MQVCLPAGRSAFARSARRKSEATGSRRAKPFLKNLDFQIYSKYFQAFGLELKAISRFSVWISKFFL
jgi:hypothetical protein